MVSVSFTISDELKSRMEKFSWINWSEIAREEALEHDKKIVLLDELDDLTKDSKITDKDCLEFAKRVKKRIWQKVKKELQEK